MLEDVGLMDTRTKDERTAPSEKRLYSRPRLRDFGPVGKLTQSGTALRPEPGSGNNPNRNRT
jgi:hypothetical protein